MCGLAGFFGNVGSEQARVFVTNMLDAQKHRGPDAAGIWSTEIHKVYVGLGLTRLKILDLSDSANQPMLSESGRYVLVYNGELYNYIELRNELAACGSLFRTQGDTEVILKALMTWGQEAFTRFNGMWALVLLDRATGEVTLSRDRFGVKPLYTYRDERGLFVSSEIKSILKAVGRKFQVNANVADAYLHQTLLCTGQSTFFRGIEEFPAGHSFIDAVENIAKKSFEPKRYWTISSTYCEQQSESELIEKVREIFIEAVKLRLRSDVPAGVLLSGGIDSSAIAATVHHLDPLRDDIKLISAVGENGKSDEQPFIDTIAQHLKRPVEKVVLDYSSSHALEMISEAIWFNDEPIGSFSTVAHYLLMKRAKELGVTVLLSGQGADEILCGYNKYLGFYLQQLIASGRWLVAARLFASFVRRGTVLSQSKYKEAKRYLPNLLRRSEIDVRGPLLLEAGKWIHVGLNGRVTDRQTLDLSSLSIPALVHYEDRMSMAHAREIRLPFLDYRLVNLLVPMPVELKIRAGWTKWIFRKALEPLLPQAIAWRKDKQNFIVPQNDWFRTELQGHLAKLLQSEWLSERLGIIDRHKVSMRYEAYLRQSTAGGQLSTKDIFVPIAMELWARRFEGYLN